MDEIHISFFQYLPLIEIIYSDFVREPLRFLANGLETTKEIERRYKQRRSEKVQSDFISKIEAISFRNYSNLKWCWNDDGFNYYRSIRNLTFDKQPVRSLIPMSTKAVKWKIDDNHVKCLASTKKIELNTYLVAKIQKKISLRMIEKNGKNFIRIHKLLQNQCNEEKKTVKQKILKGIFCKGHTVNANVSDTITIIEMIKSDYNKLYLEHSKSNFIRFEDVSFYLEDFNKVFIIYDKSPSKLFRARIIKVISLIFSLKFLHRRMDYLIDKGVLENLGVKEKSNLLEYLLSALDPGNYSSIQRIDLLLKHYQRVIFSNFVKKNRLDSSFHILKEKVKIKIEKLPTYEVAYFFNRKNVFTNRLRDEVTLKLAKLPEPKLMSNERVMLDFFIHKYKEDLSDEGLMDLKVKRELPLGMLTRNYIRENINTWLSDKGLPIDTFTDTELKVPPLPSVIEALAKHDLVRIYKKEKGRAEFHIHLNDENDYVKNLIFLSP